MSAIRTHRRVNGFERCRLFNKLRTATTVDMNHVKFIDAPSFGVNNVFPIRCPICRREILIGFLGKLHGIFLFCIDVPKVFSTTFI